MPPTQGPPVGHPSGAAAFGVAAVPPAAITVGASPFTYTAGANIEVVHVQAAAASTCTVAKRGVTVANMVQAAATNSTATIILGPGESAVVTYTVLPVMIKDVP
jgi:hypothetical protein